MGPLIQFFPCDVIQFFGYAQAQCPRHQIILMMETLEYAKEFICINHVNPDASYSPCEAFALARANLHRTDHFLPMVKL
jgi:hypothetical protein